MKASLASETEEILVKRIQRYVGHRMVLIHESDFQYQVLVKWHSLSHHHDCWVCFILSQCKCGNLVLVHLAF